MNADIIDAEGHSQPVQSDGATTTSPIPSHRRESANYGLQSPDLGNFPLPLDSPAAAMYQHQLREGPSTLPTPRLTMGLRRSSAQHYNSGAPSRKRHSLSPNTNATYSPSPSSPISPRRKKPYNTSPPPGSCCLDEPTQSRAVHNLSQQIPAILTLSPQSHSFPLVAESPTSPIVDDGLSRYPPHFSSPYPVTPRQT